MTPDQRLLKAAADKMNRAANDLTKAFQEHIKTSVAFTNALIAYIQKQSKSK